MNKNSMYEEMRRVYGIEGCACARCVGPIIAARPFPENMLYPFLVCEFCGNKRCPHTADHDLKCTGSNAPGQPGSMYPKYEPEEQ